MENNEKKKEYQESIVEKLKKMERKQDVNAEWINIKNVILETAKKKLENRGGKGIRTGMMKNAR